MLARYFSVPSFIVFIGWVDEKTRKKNKNLNIAALAVYNLKST
jgi:hypothetical protein